MKRFQEILNYLRLSAPIADSTDRSELYSEDKDNQEAILAANPYKPCMNSYLADTFTIFASANNAWQICKCSPAVTALVTAVALKGETSPGTAEARAVFALLLSQLRTAKHGHWRAALPPSVLLKYQQPQ